MSSRQLEVCAARMPPAERLQFLQLMAEAWGLFVFLRGLAGGVAHVD